MPDTVILERLLTRLDPSERRLFVFVNGSLYPAATALLNRMPNAHLIWSAENIGLGAGLNAITRAAAAESFSHIMLLDQDSEPSVNQPEDLLQRWTEATRSGARLAVVGPWLAPPREGNYRPIKYAWRPNPDKALLAPVHFAPTSGTLICLSAFRAIGPFREDFFIGGIDVEWGFRAWSQGYASVIARDIKMLHRWGEPASPRAPRMPQILRHSKIREYYYIRNAVYSLTLSFIPLSWRVRYALGLLGQIGLLAIYSRALRRHGGLVFAAVRDGVRGRLGPIPAGLLNDSPP